MRTFVYICTLTLFIAVLTPKASARVLGSDLENGVAVYYFTSLTNLGNVFDQSGNGLRGDLFSGAQLSTVSGHNCLSLKSTPIFRRGTTLNPSLSQGSSLLLRG